MKVIVNDNKKKKLANEDTCYGCEDELNEFLEDSEYVPMTIPILKQRVWIPVKEELDPQGHRWISIDEWMPLGSLYKFKKSKWLPIGYRDDDEEDWVPFEDMLGEYDDEDEYDDGECDVGDWE